MLTWQLSEEWLWGIFQGVEEGVLIADSDLKVVAVNPSVELLLGKGSLEFQGKDYVEILQSLNFSFQASPQILSFLFSDEEINYRTIFLEVPGKGRIILEERIKKISNSDSKGYIIFLKDISSDTGKIKELTESEKKYKGLYENILEGIFVINEKGFITDANPAACRIYNLDKNNLIGQHVSFVFPHKTFDEAVEIWNDFMNTGFLEGFYKFEVGNNEVRYIDFKARTNFLPNLHLAVFSDVTEKTITEKALRTSEANLKAIFNNTKQQLILLDKDLRIITYNDAANNNTLERLGTSLKVGEFIYSYGNPGDKERYAPIYERVAAGESMFLEVEATFFPNSDQWLEVGFIPVFDSKKNLKAYLISSADITFRKKAEIALAESEARFRSMVQNSSDIITILSADGVIKYASASIEKILGFSEESLINKSFIDFVHKDERDIVAKLLGKFNSGENVNSVLEYRFLHSQGYYVYLETTWNNLLGNEHIKGIVLNTRDITERKNQEENLLLLERAIDSSSNGIIISDPNQIDNPIIYANKAFEQITGYNYFEIIGKNCRYLQGEDKDQQEIQEIRKAIHDQEEVSVIVRNYKKDGSLFWNHLSISPVFNRNGQLTNYIGVINDITERKVAEDAMLEISQGISSKVDFDIYEALVTHIGLRLEMDIVFIGEYIENKIKTKAFWKDKKIEENVEYILKGSPCYEVLTSGSCRLFENVQEGFPEDKDLVDFNVNSYMGVPLKDSHGNITGILVVMSRRKFSNFQLAESILNIFSVRASAELERDYYIQALKSSETRFKDLAKNSPDVIYIIDIDLKKVVYFNRDVIIGYKTSELSDSEDWMRIVHPDDIDRVKKHWKHFLDSRQNVTTGIEYRIMNKDGIYEWVINRHIVLEWSSDGNPKQILLNLSIITERKKAEEGLRASEARLTALIENTNDIMWSVDKDLNFTTMNSSFKTLMLIFYNKRIELGTKLNENLPKEIRDEWVDYHEKALLGQRFSVEFNLGASSGEISYEISYNPIYSDRGKISGVSVFGRDITQRKHAENDIIRTNFELDSFVYRASHDLRAPLRSVLGLINLARNEMDDKERNVYLSLVEKSVNKLDTFISDLTNFSRNSRLEINVTKINFRQIIEDCFENLKYMDMADRIKSYISISDNEDFYSDATRLNIVIQNLLSNAIKYQNPRIEDPYVRIFISINRKIAQIIIEDNGKGIKEEYLDKIFNMFFRASQESYGSGLGLYIARQVVEKLGGAIHVQSKFGQGTQFTITLPNLL